MKHLMLFTLLVAGVLTLCWTEYALTPSGSTLVEDQPFIAFILWMLSAFAGLGIIILLTRAYVGPKIDLCAFLGLRRKDDRNLP